MDKDSLDNKDAHRCSGYLNGPKVWTECSLTISDRDWNNLGHVSGVELGAIHSKL